MVQVSKPLKKGNVQDSKKQDTAEVKVKQMWDALKEHISECHLVFCNGDSVLAMLYEAYSDCNQMEDAQIKAAFEELHRQMNGLDLHEMDRILDPVCSLCRSHERAGFVNGIRLGVKLFEELESKE